MFMKIIFQFALFVAPVLVFAQVQYQPLSSVQRHELSISASVKSQDSNFHFNLKQKNLNYAIYFPELVSLLFPSQKKGWFIPALSMGFHGFKKDDTQKLHQTCQPASDLLGLIPGYIGFKGILTYLELIQPFAELAYARFLCYKKNPQKMSFYKNNTLWSWYHAYGVFLSLKLLDKIGIYSLDQDYGINDLGLKLACSSYYKTTKIKLTSCHIGMQISF